MSSPGCTSAASPDNFTDVAKIIGDPVDGLVREARNSSGDIPSIESRIARLPALNECCPKRLGIVHRERNPRHRLSPP